MKQNVLFFVLKGSSNFYHILYLPTIDFKDMLQSQKEIRTKKLENRKHDGQWFPFSDNYFLKNIEKIGRPIAFSIRGFPFLRRYIGADSFKWWMVGWAFVWYRAWVAVLALETPYELTLVNPFILAPNGAAALNIFSYVFLLLCIYYKSSQPVQFSVQGKDVDMGMRGKSYLFNYRIAGKETVNKDWFKHLVVEPVLIISTGVALLILDEMIGCFFIISGAVFWIDEGFYYSADRELFNIERQGKKKGETSMTKHEKMDENAEDENGIYD